MTDLELRDAIQDVVKPFFDEVNKNLVQLNRNFKTVNGNLEDADRRLLARLNGGFLQLENIVRAVNR